MMSQEMDALFAELMSAVKARMDASPEARAAVDELQTVCAKVISEVVVPVALRIGPKLAVMKAMGKL